MTEIWKDVPGYEGFYQVSDQGNVRSVTRVLTFKTGQVQTYLSSRLSPQLVKKKWLGVTLFKNNKQTRKGVHKLVAEVFLGPRPKGMCVRHKDGNVANNCLENLFYGKRQYGAPVSGVKNGQAKLNETQVRLLRTLPRGYTLCLAKEWGVSQPTVSRARTGARWRHI